LKNELGRTFGAFGAGTVALTSPRKHFTRQGSLDQFGAFGAVTLARTSPHKQLPCLTLRVSHRAWTDPGEWLNTTELQSKRSNPNARRPIWCIWCGIFIPPIVNAQFCFFEKNLSCIWCGNSALTSPRKHFTRQVESPNLVHLVRLLWPALAPTSSYPV
jgi:hypothetical protein